MSWCGGGEIRSVPGFAIADLGDLGRHLLAHELAALAGLRALGHLDREFVGVDEVLGVDAEAPARDLANAAAEPARSRIPPRV